MKHWSFGTMAIASTIALLSCAWRADAQTDSLLPMSFAGLTLAQAEDSGIAASPDVAAARARVDGARASLASVGWGVLPSGFANFSEQPQAGPGPAPTSISTHLATFGVSASLNDILFGFVPLIGQASSNFRAAIANETAAEHAERIAAARAYFSALKAVAVLSASEDALRLAHSELQAAQTRFRAGDVPKVDVVRAEVAVARAEADEENASASDANAREALRVETAAASDAVASTAGGAPPIVPTLALDPNAAATQALLLRPEVRSAQAALDASNSALHGAWLSVVPPVTVASGYATGVDTGQRVAGSSVSAQVTVPLPTGTAARINQANAAVAEAKAHLASVQRVIALETAASARTLVAADRAAAATLRARDAARQALDAEELGYRSGATSGLEVAQARSTYVQAQVDALSAVYDEAVAVAIFDIEAGR